MWLRIVVSAYDACQLIGIEAPREQISVPSPTHSESPRSWYRERSVANESEDPDPCQAGDPSCFSP
jgi:hypothetical protein